ncbi:hypothetical protein SAMN02745671_01672 [Anaerovibrio lipolyticus DSM 3074]|uniref:Uncharacterized protein n=2 Tax=Anaerovibrio lipolyticus TaxID=82374 RepID=A0A0B2JY95_9FIRM|nr:hypothetical protein [Anaerovibrio lipolyticus]KHM51621.1 hypothetical protein NZ47_09575 [Anaerovibrio lipolyticus]SHI78556.1 hypothetical protein SAMN02745671_01672 [Anaerovibrio lipolyticus DSM 3074]
MEINVNVRISADEGLTQILTDIAAVLACREIKKVNPPATTVAKPSDKVVELPKPEAKKESKAEAKAEAKAPEHNPDDILDKKLLPKIRETVGAYCKKVGAEEGKAAVKKWLEDNGFDGLSKLTYAGADSFVAFLEKEATTDA